MGRLFVYSSGYQYKIEDVSEEAAQMFLESFHAVHAHDGDVDYEDWIEHPDSEGDWYLFLPYGKIDALAWQRYAA